MIAVSDKISHCYGLAVGAHCMDKDGKYRLVIAKRLVVSTNQFIAKRLVGIIAS